MHKKRFPHKFLERYGGRETEKIKVKGRSWLSRVTMKSEKTESVNQSGITLASQTPNETVTLASFDIPAENLIESRKKVEKENPGMSKEEIKELAQEDAKRQWLAFHTVEFFEGVNGIYEQLAAFHIETSEELSYESMKENYEGDVPLPEFFAGFPPGIKYRCRSHVNCGVSTGAEYVEHSFLWIKEQLDDSFIFPQTSEQNFPRRFVEKYVRDIFKRMLRILAFIYTVCWPQVVKLKMEQEVHAFFKYFYFFMTKFGLMGKASDKVVFRRSQMNLEALEEEYATQKLFTDVQIPAQIMADCGFKMNDRKHKIVKSEATNLWLSTNSAKFYEEVSHLYEIVAVFHQKISNPDTYSLQKEEFKASEFPPFADGYPEGFEYRIGKSKKSRAGKLNGAEYVEQSLLWIKQQLEDPTVFPVSEDGQFPAKFAKNIVPEVFKQLFRIYAIIYAVCWPFVAASKMESELNVSFKHFYFFMRRFSLLKRKSELLVFQNIPRLQSIVDLAQLDEELSTCNKELTGV